MRAYAIVRKPQAGLHEHVIKLTKQQPKICINSISQNRLTSPHKTVANDIHELQNSGAYFKFNNQLEEHSIKSNSRQEQNLNVEQPQVQKGQEININGGHALPVQENHPKVEKTKRLFREFPVSPIKAMEPPHQQKIKSTPVRQLESEPQIAVLPAQSLINQPKKPRIFEYHQHKEQHEQYEQPKVVKNDIIMESEQKNVFCCRQVSSDSYNQPFFPPPIIFSKFLPPQEKHDSSKKRKIFDEFQDRDRVVQQFPFKEPCISSGNPTITMKQPAERSLKIKIYEFAPIAPFDI